MSSGDLGRIRSEGIRRALTTWRREPGDVLEKETLALEFAEIMLMPALAGQGFVGEATLLRPPHWTPTEDARITVRASPEFSDLVASRIVHERLAIRDSLTPPGQVFVESPPWSRTPDAARTRRSKRRHYPK